MRSFHPLTFPILVAEEWIECKMWFGVYPTTIVVNSLLIALYAESDSRIFAFRLIARTLLAGGVLILLVTFPEEVSGAVRHCIAARGNALCVPDAIGLLVKTSAAVFQALVPIAFFVVSIMLIVTLTDFDRTSALALRSGVPVMMWRLIAVTRLLLADMKKAITEAIDLHLLSGRAVSSRREKYTLLADVLSSVCHRAFYRADEAHNAIGSRLTQTRRHPEMAVSNSLSTTDLSVVAIPVAILCIVLAIGRFEALPGLSSLMPK